MPLVGPETLRKLEERIAVLSENQRVANTREHMSWAHKFALLWLALSLLLFGGGYALAEIGEMSDSSRTLMFIMLSVIIVTNAIWQATGLAIARLQNMILPRQNVS